jgi:PAS domain S-box-containing protein
VTVLRCCAVAVLGLAALSGPAHAHPGAFDEDPPGQARFRVFAGDEGLRNFVIVSITQDASGFLWLATDDGVYRFDGERFTHFSADDGLISSTVSVVGVASDGQVCAGSKNGLVCWNGTRFTQANVRGLPSVPIRGLVAFAGRTWVGTEGAGLYVQDATGTFAPAPGWPEGEPLVGALWADAAGLVVGDDAAVRLTTGDGAWQTVELAADHDRVLGLVRDPAGALWVRTPLHLWHVRAGSSTAEDLRDGLPHGYDASAAASCMAIGPRGDVLVGTDVGIAYREHDRWRVIGRQAGLPAPGVRTLFVDDAGTVWGGALGLIQLRGRGVIERHDAASGLPGDVMWAARRDRDGRMWLATSRCLARAEHGAWTCLPGTEGRIVRSFVFAPQGGVFLGGAPADLLYLDERGRATSITGFDRPPELNILALALSGDGDLWIATKAGLYRLPGAIPGPLVHVEIPGTRPTARFASLAIVGSQLWTATDEGVVVLDRGAWHVFARSAGFRSSAMRYVTPRADGRLCAAYTEAIGLSCFRYDGHAIRDLEHVGPREGLGTGMVYFLGEDAQRRLWVGTGNGVDVVTPGGIDHFDESDGLAGNDSAATAFLLDRDGSLWLGANGGATHVFAADYRGPPRPPRAALLDGTLGDLAIGRPGAVLEVPHDRNALTLALAASNLLDPRRVEYQVRLSPLEAVWSTTHLRQVRYPALLPGRYRFDVRARIGTGAWGPATALEFAVLPAWWQTRWFLVAAVVAGLGAIGAGFAVRQHAVLRRRTRQLHEQSDLSFRAVIDRMPDLISVHRDRKLVYVNRANRRFLGLEGAGHDWGDLDLLTRVHPDDRDPVSVMFQKVRDLDAEGVPDVVEIRIRDGEGRWRICEVSGVLVEVGGAPTVVASGRDITERKRMRAKLMMSDRMASLGTLAAGIAHEINNPLAYVTGNLESIAEALQAGAGAPDAAVRAELAAAIGDARDGAERVRKIVHGLRSFSRPEQEHRVPLALGGVIEAAIRLTGNEVRHRAQLVRELGATPLVLADDGRLTQVFINLLVNAAHAIPDGRSDDNRITVRTRTDEQGRAVIEVEDTGKGIAPDLLSRVFDPFFTTKEVGEGTGLGLAICHGIVSSLGGQITIESAVGRGTVVRVVLPAAIAAPPLAAEVSSTALAVTSPERRPRVMLVDDEPLIAQTMERLLRKDYEITIALCGREAIDRIEQGGRYDAIVSDVMMPNMTGIELVEELQRVAPDQARRIIFLSGGAFTAQTRERLDELGMPQLEKPVTAKELRTWVMRVAREPTAPAA